MINVDVNFVGFSDQIVHTSLTVSHMRPTVKSALEAFRDRNVRRDSFDFDERMSCSRTAYRSIIPCDDNGIMSMTYRGLKLQAGINPLNPHEKRVWRFSVLRRAGNRSVLIQNDRSLPFDQFKIQDGDQIFWSLITVMRSQKEIAALERVYESDRLIAV